jgi:hypothetical protein
MLETWSLDFLYLGRKMEEARFIFRLTEAGGADESQKVISEQEERVLDEVFEEMFKLSKSLALPVSREMIATYLNQLPRTGR